MQLIYISLSLITLCYIFFKNRRIDFFTVYIFSVLIYYFPAYFGYIYSSHSSYTMINNLTYVVLIINLAIILWFTVVYDLSKNRVAKLQMVKNDIVNSNSSNKYNSGVLIIGFITLSLIIISAIQYGTISGNGFNKMQLLASSNKLIEYTKYFSTFIFVYAFTNTGKRILIIRIIALVSILYTFMLGHRSFLVIGMICIGYHFIVNRTNFKSVVSLILNNKLIVSAILIFGMFVLFVKNVFAAFMNGNYDLVWQRLGNKEYYINTFLSSEPTTITNNLNNVIQSGIDYELVSYLAFIIFGLIPFLGNIILTSLNIKSFEYLLQINFNARLSEGVGLGSTFLGESYSTGGFIFLFIVGIFVCILILILEKGIFKTSNPLVRTWLMIFLSYLTFYISRNSLIFILISARAYLYILVLTLVLTKVIVIFSGKNKNKKRQL